MNIMKFKYFRDPDNFAFKVDEALACSICGRKGIWFDAGGFFGENEIDCICDKCLVDGRLENLGIETNEVSGGYGEEARTIIYKTPALPTWQDRSWPYINGEYCVFERVASKADFESKQEFMGTFFAQDSESSDLDWLWEMLPESRISNHFEGSLNISVYLFTCQGQKLCIWDAS